MSNKDCRYSHQIPQWRLNSTLFLYMLHTYAWVFHVVPILLINFSGRVSSVWSNRVAYIFSPTLAGTRAGLLCVIASKKQIVEPCFNTVLSRGVRSLFGPTRKSSPVGAIFPTVDQINQSSVDFHSETFDRLIDWLIDGKLTLTWLVYWIRTAWSVFTGAGLRANDTVAEGKRSVAMVWRVFQAADAFVERT